MMNDKPEQPLPVNAEPGDPVDVKQTAQIITPADVQAIAVSEESVDLRRGKLLELKDDVQARLSTDHGNELAPIAHEIDRALKNLDSAGGEAGTRSAIAADTTG